MKFINYLDKRHIFKEIYLPIRVDYILIKIKYSKVNLSLFLDPYHMLMLHDVVSVFRFFNLNYRVNFHGFSTISPDVCGYTNLEKCH